MIIKTNLKKLDNLLDRDATVIFRNKAKDYIQSSNADKVLEHWNKYLIKKYKLNLKQSCFQVINASTITTVNNSLLININKEWEQIYRTLLFGTLAHKKTFILENAFKYALRRL